MREAKARMAKRWSRMVVSRFLADTGFAHPRFGKSLAAPGQWNRWEASIDGDKLSVKLNENTVIDAALVDATTGPLKISAAGPATFSNIYVREGERP